MSDFISIGDSTIDNYLQIHDAQVKCNLDKTQCMICVKFGEKIPVDKLFHHVAGNAANSSIGASRLKLKSAIYTNIGSDASGVQIKEKLLKEGIDTKYVVENNGESNMSTVLTFQGERTIFVYHQDWRYKLPDLTGARWIYFTSLGPSFSESNILHQIEEYLERKGAKMLYSPGTYQIKYGVKKVPRLLVLSEVFIVNIEEAKRVLNYEEEENVPVKKLLKKISDLGPKIVVLTDAEKGSYAYDGETYYHISSFPANLIEMTGAGDAYATGLLCGLFYGKDLKEAMRWGAANGASVVEHVGPHMGLLTLTGMKERLKANSKITASVI